MRKNINRLIAYIALSGASVANATLLNAWSPQNNNPGAQAKTMVPAMLGVNATNTDALWQTSTTIGMCNKKKIKKVKNAPSSNPCIEPFMLIQSANKIGLQNIGAQKDVVTAITSNAKIALNARANSDGPAPSLLSWPKGNDVTIIEMPPAQAWGDKYGSSTPSFGTLYLTVPEPPTVTLLLLSLGLIGTCFVDRRTQKHKRG